MENYKALVKESFKAVVEDLTYNEAAVEKYFSKKYVQKVDGKELDYQGFCQHMKVQKQALKHLSTDFITLVQEGGIVFTHHIVNMETKEGRSASIQVIAEFHVEEGKIIYCNELTHLRSGDEQDRDLGSRH